MDIITTLFSYSFVTRAVVVGILVSLCSSVLGVSLVLKRYSMIGDGLSHVSFGALAVAAALNMAPLAVSIPIVIVSAFIILRLSSSSSVGGDSAIAIFSSAALAIGIIITSMTKGINADICNYMFGSILAMSDGDVFISIVLSVVVLVLYILFYNRLFAITFDESFARATGIRVSIYNITIAVLTAVTIVIGMRIMGALLISSLIIFPALSAMQVCRFFKGAIITSAVISILCFIIGIIASYIFEVPVGASVVVINLCVFLITMLIRKIIQR